MEIENYLDKSGKIKCWPKRHKSRLVVLKHLVNQFKNHTFYSEREVNEIIKENHSFGDYFLLRRELIDYHLLLRTRDGSKYWRNDFKVETERFKVVESDLSHLDELKDIYVACGYISEYTNYEHKSEEVEGIVKEGDLPPNGKKEFRHLKSIVDKSSNELIGFYEVYLGYPNEDTLWIASFFIHPRFQNKGYGKEMIDEINRCAFKNGFNCVGLGVAHPNIHAFKFWVARGFDKIMKITRLHDYDLIGLLNYKR